MSNCSSDCCSCGHDNLFVEVSLIWPIKRNPHLLVTTHTTIHRIKKEDKNDLVDGVYEDPDKSASKEGYEMMQNPVSKTETAGEPVPQPTEAQSSQDEFS